MCLDYRNKLFSVRCSEYWINTNYIIYIYRMTLGKSVIIGLQTTGERGTQREWTSNSDATCSSGFISAPANTLKRTIFKVRDISLHLMHGVYSNAVSIIVI